MNPDERETEPHSDDYTGDQAQDPGPDDEDRLRPADRFRVMRRPARYFRWPLDSAATTPRPM
ncbi:MAG TPA: hypothetical protein VIA61_16690 [Methylomirabilota bacterium]|jgi:hypothetical protein